MFKKWLIQFIALSICIITILSSVMIVDAAPYKASSTSGDATYYIVEGKDVNKLFDFGIWDIGNLANWIFQFKTFTVIKKYTDTNGIPRYKMYFNTPNLQSILKNKIISTINDGYTESTYTVEDTEWVVPVGQNATTENAITKYGFDIPNYTYNGEYPKELMTVAGILPTSQNWFKNAWRAIKSLFGASFIQAPTSDNYNTITYMNHTYKNKDDYILNFFKKYYLDYFERKIPINHINATDPDKAGEYFSGPEEVIELAITKEAYDAAVDYNKAHKDEYNEAVQRYIYWDTYQSSGIPGCLRLDQTVGNKKYDSWHFLASITKFHDTYEAWINNNISAAYILLQASEKDVFEHDEKSSGNDHKRYSPTHGMKMVIPSLSTDAYNLKYDKPYKNNTYFDTTTSIAADTLRYAETQLKANITYDIQISECSVNSRSNTVNFPSGSTESDGYNHASSYSDWRTTKTITEDVYFTDTAVWRDFIYGTYSHVFSSEEINKSSHSYTSGKDDLFDNTYSSWTETSYTIRRSRYANYKINYLWDGSDKEKQMSYDPTYKNFVATCSYGSYTYDESDFVPAKLQGIYQAYLSNVELIEKYEKFCEYLNRGDDQPDATSKKELLYRQCLIENESENDEDCWSRKYGTDKTSLSLVQVYAFSGIYSITQDYTNNVHELTDEDTLEILNTLQAYCGLYYPEVLGNMIKVMCATSKYDGNNELTSYVISDDTRVMPYDIDTLVPADQTNYTVVDPRTELYKNSVLGKLITELNLNTINASSFSNYIKLQPIIIKFAGKITEISVFLQSICNFTIFDDLGLSPSYLWDSPYVAILLGAITVFFIIQTVSMIFKTGTKSAFKIVIGFIILIIELGTVTTIAANSERVWTAIKNVENKVINIGELSTVYSITDLTYLYGSDTSYETTYYIPYLDLWSMYNTGYGLLEPEQKIDYSSDYRELYEFTCPKLAGQDIKHWSVLLMDSFNYYGDNDSISAVLVNGKPCNGPTINNNAYRVVDHFLAPRVDITGGGSTLNITTTENENYNGQFQHISIALFAKLLNCILCCLLSIIKTFTFIWQWFLFYIFIFRYILGTKIENKTTSRIVLETFAPTLAMIFIGMISGMIMIMSMDITNGTPIIGIVFEFLSFFVVIKLMKWWHESANAFFPKILSWFYIITNINLVKRKIARDRITNRARHDADINNMPEGYADMSLDEQREVLFESNGQIKSQYRDSKYQVQIKDWYKRANNINNNPDEGILSIDSKQQLKMYQQDAYLAQILKNTNNPAHNRPDKISGSTADPSSSIEERSTSKSKSVTSPTKESDLSKFDDTSSEENKDIFGNDVNTDDVIIPTSGKIKYNKITSPTTPKRQSDELPPEDRQSDERPPEDRQSDERPPEDRPSNETIN